MPPIVVEGNTLGEIHRNYNYAVTSRVETNIEKLNYNDQDLENLYKIDQAIRNKNVDFIIETFKSKDILYCSRAIKQSTWMINDPQYSHIINPDYLFSKLFPEMISKARNKLLLHIRINLKDKQCAREFFEKLIKVDIKTALKWLPYCPESYIIENLKNYVNDISLAVLMRLTEISLNFLYIFCMAESNTFNSVSLYTAVNNGMRYANSDIEKYLDILDGINEYELPTLNSKTTGIIMKKCPERIFDNLDRYGKVVDTRIFAKFIKTVEIKSFIVDHIINKETNYCFLLNIKHFILRIPEQERFEFVQENFIEKRSKIHDDAQAVTSKLENVYKWYFYAPFDKTFVDLKQLIRLESSASERHAMMFVVLDRAGNNLQNIYQLLEYYKANHINEALKFKSNFINTFLDKTSPCDFNEKTWSTLQDIFKSMGVFSESDNSLQSCIRWIMMYKIIHNQTIPDVIISKFNISTFKNEQRKLKDCEKEKVFEYLLNFTREKLRKCAKENYQDIQSTSTWTNNMLNLLRDWHKDLKNYPDVIEIIKVLSSLPKEKRTSAVFSHIYNKKKSWRKYLLNESILLSPSESTCINALKHNPQLLHSSRDEIEDIALNDKVSFKLFLCKLRVYKIDLARDFKEMYSKNLEKGLGRGLKASVKGLCWLLSLDKISSLLKKYVPEDGKINWNQIDERKLNLQKYLAGNIHVARPQPPICLIVPYAHGDYLQYVLASLTSIICNISSAEFQKLLINLIDTPVSLQKHIIRGAYLKCQIVELINIMSSIWERNKNSSIRATIFRLTFNSLCTETESENIQRLWSVMSVFIDSLTVDENRIIFVTFCLAHQVPMEVRPAFCMKSYSFIKQLTEKSSRGDILHNILNCTKDIMEFMDPDFMITILMESFDKNIRRYIDIISAFILSTRDEKSQIYRYENVLLPLLMNFKDIWKSEKENQTRVNLRCLLNTLLRDIENVVIKKNMLMPITLFRLILEKLKELNFEENYTLITSRKLALDFVVVLDACLKNDRNVCVSHPKNIDTKNITNLNYFTVIEKFSQTFMNNLKDDIQKYGTIVVFAFKTALDDVFDHFSFCDANMKLELCEQILNDNETKEGFLLALLMIPNRQYNSDGKKQIQLIEKISSHSDNEVKILCSIFKNNLELLI